MLAHCPHHPTCAPPTNPPTHTHARTHPRTHAHPPLVHHPPLADEESEQDQGEMEAEFQAHMSAVDAQTDALMRSCFALLPRLAETESMASALPCPPPPALLACLCAAPPPQLLLLLPRRAPCTPACLPAHPPRCCAPPPPPPHPHPQNTPPPHTHTTLPPTPPAHPHTPMQVRVLHCVSATVELTGERVRPHLPAITSALPQARALAMWGGAWLGGAWLCGCGFVCVRVLVWG